MTMEPKAKKPPRKPVLSLRLQNVLPKIYNAIQDGERAQAMRHLAFYMSKQYPQHDAHIRLIRLHLFRLYEMEAFFAPTRVRSIYALCKDFQKALEPYMNEQDAAIFREIMAEPSAASENSTIEPDAYFDEEKEFSLAELEKIDAPRSFLSPGIKKATLVELTYDWGFEKEIRQSVDLQKTLIRRNKSELEKKPEIVSAKFKLLLDKKGNHQRMVTLENGNKARLDRSEDGLLIEDWVRAQRFLKVENKKQESNNVEFAEEAAFA